jgi:anti-sigma factor RsiW
MKNHWHEQIQRYANGQLDAAQSAALEAALNQDAELRELYLDYMNLDVALCAAAESASIHEIGAGGIARLSPSPAQSSPRRWHWLTAAACVALVLMGMLHGFRKPFRKRPDVAAACASAQKAIERISVAPSSSFPEWASPTASMLDQPRIPKLEL